MHGERKEFKSKQERPHTWYAHGVVDQRPDIRAPLLELAQNSILATPKVRLQLTKWLINANTLFGMQARWRINYLNVVRVRGEVLP